MADFDFFVVFAEMRTGSNFLEDNLNAFAGLRCHGEVFNPHFIGHKDKTELMGVSMQARERDPMRLITVLKAQEGLNGFRFFHDHDPRVLDALLRDKRCAKVVLTRNPLESYVSRKIAAETGQWKLTDAKHRKSAKIRFDEQEFLQMLDKVQGFQVRLQHALQASGQTAFYLTYEDALDLDVVNGLAAFLGVDESMPELSTKLKKQNPAPLSDKVENYDQMTDALARMDPFQLGQTPSFEPRRGPLVPGYVAAAEAPLLYMPLRGGPVDQVEQWLAGLDRVGVDGLQRQFTQKSLRQWKRKNPGHRSFTVVTHPLERAHNAFCAHILKTGPDAFPEIRKALMKSYKVPLPEGGPKADYSVADHRAAFVGFLKFLKANLAGQTSLRIDASWASQTTIIQGMAEFAVPDIVIRAERLVDDLALVSAQVGRGKLVPMGEAPAHPVPLAQIYDGELEKMARDIYQRDYMMFGYRGWGE